MHPPPPPPTFLSPILPHHFLAKSCRSSRSRYSNRTVTILNRATPFLQPGCFWVDYYCMNYTAHFFTLILPRKVQYNVWILLQVYHRTFIYIVRAKMWNILITGVWCVSRIFQRGFPSEGFEWSIRVFRASTDCSIKIFWSYEEWGFSIKI